MPISPRHPSPKIFAAAALAAILAGCSTTDGGMSALLESQSLQAEAAGDDGTAEASLAWESSPLPEAAPFAPTARPDDGGLPGIAPAGYAGSTPTSVAQSAQVALAATGSIQPPAGRLGPTDVTARSPELDQLIARYAAHYQVPEQLVRRVVNRESTFNPKARNGPYWGLMQILPATARTMGHSGPASELLDADTNLKYAVRYLRGAYLVAGGNHDQAVRHYARGYYYDARDKGMLGVTGLGKDRRRMR